MDRDSEAIILKWEFPKDWNVTVYVVFYGVAK